MAFLCTFLPGNGTVPVQNLDASGIVTAAGGFVGNVTGNLAGNVTGLVDGVDIDTKAPIASPTFTGTLSAPTISNATALNLNGIMTGSATSPAQFTANQTDVDLGATLVSRVSSDASRNVYSALGSALQFQWIINVGAQNIVFIHDDGVNGTANLRFSLKGAANYTLAPGAIIGRYYDLTTARWRLTQP